MNWARVFTILQKELITIGRDPLQISDLAYWPFLDILLWGFTSSWFVAQQADAPILALTTLTALTLFHLMSRAHMDVAGTLVYELWGRNLINLFSSPLNISEWAMAAMLLGFIKGSFTALFCSLVIWLLHGFNVLSLGLTLVPFMFALIISGWSTGFFISGLLMYWGVRAQTLIWSISWLLAAICGVFYPIDILPRTIQYISRLFPMTYAFEGIRYAVSTNTSPLGNAFTSIGMSIIYFVATYTFFTRMFGKSKEYGLSRLEQE